MRLRSSVEWSLVGLWLVGAAVATGCDQRVLVGNMRPDDPATGTGGASVVLGGYGGSGVGGTGSGPAGIGGDTGTPGGTGGASYGLPSCSRISTAVNTVNPCGHTSGVAYSSDGSLLATGVMDSQPGIHVWRLSDGALVGAFDGFSQTTYDVAFSPDGKTLAAVGQPRTSDTVAVMLYDLVSGALTRTLVAPGVGLYATSVAFSPDGTLIAASGNLSAIEVWRLSDGALVTSIPYTTTVHNVHFSPTGTQLIAGAVDQRATIWNLPSGTLALTLNGIAAEMADATFSPDGTQIASTSNAGNGIRIWDVASGALLQTLSGHANYVSSVVWVDDNLIVSGDWQGNVISWTRTNAITLARSQSWNTGGQVLGIAVSPDRTRVVLGAGTTSSAGTVGGTPGFEFLRP